MLAQAGFVLPIQFGQWLPIGAVLSRQEICEVFFQLALL